MIFTLTGLFAGALPACDVEPAPNSASYRELDGLESGSGYGEGDDAAADVGDAEPPEEVYEVIKQKFECDAFCDQGEGRERKRVFYLSCASSKHAAGNDAQDVCDDGPGGIAEQITCLPMNDDPDSPYGDECS